MLGLVQAKPQKRQNFTDDTEETEETTSYHFVGILFADRVSVRVIFTHGMLDDFVSIQMRHFICFRDVQDSKDGSKC